MSEIKPALSKEEWDDALKQWETGPVQMDELLGLTAHAQSTRSQQHGAAALALYGQPFGFTREDIKALRVAAEAADQDAYYFADLAPEGDGVWEGAASIYRSLANRIESLLPPE